MAFPTLPINITAFHPVGTQRAATAAETRHLHALDYIGSGISPSLILHATAMSILRENNTPQDILDQLEAAAQNSGAIQAEANLPAADEYVSESASPPERGADSACQE